MTSEFKKLLSREFGADEYNAYFEYADRMFRREKERLEDTEKMLLGEETILKTLVFRNMEEILNQKSKHQLNKCSERLLECMQLTMNINHRFLTVFFAYLGSALLLLSLSLHVMVSVSAMILLTGCFLYKAMEFVVNKYCYIDAYLILIYKNVLLKLLQNYTGGQKTDHSV